MKQRQWRLVVLSVLVASICVVQADEAASDGQEEVFGVGASWPMQHIPDDMNQYYYHFSYTDYMNGCFKTFSKEACLRNERDRVAMNAAQPAFQRNFTSAGYAKVKAPAQAFKILSEYWEEHNKTEMKREDWTEANIHVNHWEVATWMVETPPLPASDRNIIISQVRDVLERWARTPLIPTSFYGIRVYKDGHILAPHVDRLPLVISAIINVAQDTHDDWILEMIGHDGVSREITMEPGDMVLYESHSVIHGRPYMLDGNYYANVFLHFEPPGYTEEIEEKVRRVAPKKSSKQLFEEALSKHGHQASETKESKPIQYLPPYIREGTEEAKRWKQEYIFQKEPRGRREKKAEPQVKQVTSAHLIAANGDLDQFKSVAKKDHSSLFASDSNGWKPIHEAARSGRTEIVEFLIKEGQDVNERTNQGRGANALWWAKQQLPDDHPTIRLLEQHGAIPIAPMQ